MSDHNTLSGGCLCGAVRYLVSGPPVGVTHCHCRTCRRSAGASFVTWATVPAEAFTLTTGRPAVHRSSAKVERGFCAVCGTSLTYRHDDHPQEIDFSAASLDEPESVHPRDHIWFGFKLSWLRFDDGLPQLEGDHWPHGYPDYPG